MRFHPSRQKKIIVISILIVAICGGFFAWQTTHPTQAEQAYVPESISSELLFSPYIPTKLPDDYKVDATSYAVDDQALLFVAVNSDQRRRIVFSEQALPKDFDMNNFHKTNITDASRLESTKFPVIFGQITGQEGKVASVSTEGTWTLITMPAATSKDDVKLIVDGLVRQ